MCETHLRFHPMARLGTALLVLLLPGWAWAQLAVSPIIIETRAHPGGVKTFHVNISNTGKRPLDCTIRVSAMAVQPGGLPVEVKEAPRSCKDWIEVNPDRFTLKPEEGKRLICHVRVPKKTGGGYYAIVSCHGVPQEATPEERVARGVGAGIRFTHRGLVPVLLTVPAPRVRAVIEAARPIIRVGEGGRGYRLDLPVRNRGNIHCRMVGTVEVRSDADQLIDKFEMGAGRGFILPMHERLFRSKLRVNLPDGMYLAKIRLSAKGEAPMQNAFPFYIRDGEPTVAELTDELKAKLLKQSAGFTVSPAQRLVALRAGGQRMQTIELVNLTKQTLTVQAGLLEWYRGPDGRDTVSDAKPPHGRSGLEWVSLREKALELRPLSRRRLPVVVSLPKTATGERYVAVTFDREDVKLDASPIGRARRSSMLRLWAEGTGTQKAEATDFRATRKPNGAMEFAVRVRNVGDLSIAPETVFDVKSEDGKSVGEARPAAAAAAIQAGGEMLISAEWPRVLDPGQYSAELSLRYSPKAPPIMMRTQFVVPKPAPAATTTTAGTATTDKAGKELHR